MARNHRRSRTSGLHDPARTLSEWLPLWFNELGARDCRLATFTAQEKGFRKLIRYAGDMPLAAITPELLAAWRDDMYRREGLKPSTVNGYLLRLGTFLNWVVSEGALPASPIHSTDLVACRDLASPPVFDGAQIGQLVAGARRAKSGRGAYESLRDEALITLLADTGLRASECAGLLLEHLNLPARQLFVHPEVTKGRYGRTVTFGFQTARLLGRYLAARSKHRYAFLPELFVGRQGKLSYRAVWHLVKTAGRNQGIISARPHLLRHTWAHDMKTQGVDMEVLMSLGGWQTPAMVMRYGRAEKQARAIATYQRVGSPIDRASTAKPTRKGARRNTAAG